jgi:topoisomerase-4 subunit A
VSCWPAADGYGFLCGLGDMIASKRAGKQFVSLDAAARLLQPVLFDPAEGQHLAALSSTGRLLIFPLDQMKSLSGGGKGVIIMGLDDGEAADRHLRGFRHALTLLASTRGGKAVETDRRTKRLGGLGGQARPQGQAGAGPLPGQRPAGRLMPRRQGPAQTGRRMASIRR